MTAVVGDRELAQEQVAEAFTRAWMSWGKVRRHAAPQAWVVRTALNLGVSWWRRRHREVRESFSGLCMDMPVETVFATSRVRRRRRRSGLTAAACTSVGATAAITLTSGGPVAPAISGNLPPPSSGPVKLTAFSVTNGPGDSTTLILRKGQQYQLDPSALRQALKRRGIPALVTVGTFCRSTPVVSAGSGQVKHPSNLADGSEAMVINGAAMPSGTRLSIGYGSGWIKTALIKDGAPLSCGSPFRQPAAHITPSGPKIRG